MSLIYRSSIRENESVEDYIDRLGFHNGFSSRKRFISWLDDKFEKSYGCLDWYTDGDEVHYLLKSWYKRVFALEAELESSICPTIFLAKYRFKNATKKEVCVTCWSESDYIRSYWYLSEYKTCHLHNEKLVDFHGYGQHWCEKTAVEAPAHGMECEHLVCSAVERYFGNNCLEYTLLEKYKCLFEVELIKYVSDRRGLVEESSKMAVLDVCKSGSYSQLSLEVRMDEYLGMLCERNSESDCVLRVDAALAITRNKIKLKCPFHTALLEFYVDWANKQFYSIDNLLFAFIKFSAFIDLSVIGYNHLEYLSKYTKENAPPNTEWIAYSGSALFSHFLNQGDVKDPYGSNWLGGEVEKYKEFIRENRLYDVGFEDYLVSNGEQLLMAC